METSKRMQIVWFWNQSTNCIAYRTRLVPKRYDIIAAFLIQSAQWYFLFVSHLEMLLLLLSVVFIWMDRNGVHFIVHVQAVVRRSLTAIRFHRKTSEFIHLIEYSFSTIRYQDRYVSHFIEWSRSIRAFFYSHRTFIDWPKDIFWSTY